MRIAFVIMSFKDEYDKVYHQAIQPALVDLGYTCSRADADPRPANIPFEIIRALISADLIVAEISEPSPNVFYELGVSHCLGNKTITITSQPGRIPFDIGAFRAIPYENTGPGLRLLKGDIRSTAKALLARQHEPSNLAQEAGRDYFDQRYRIEQVLEEIRRERERLKDYVRWRDLGGAMQDNTEEADKIAAHVGRLMPDKTARLLICICGSGAIGKSKFSQLLRTRIEKMYEGRLSTDILPTDAYMATRAERLSKGIKGFHPRSHRLDDLVSDVEDLLTGQAVPVRPYDHRTGEHGDERIVRPSDVLILEGIYSFHPPLAPLSRKLRYYIYAEPQKARELKFIADFTERDYDIQSAFAHANSEYEAYAEHVLPCLGFANFVIMVDEYWKYSGPFPAKEALRGKATQGV